MTTLRIPIPTDEELAEYHHEDLLQFLGEIERTRYSLADVERRIMEALDER